MLTFTEKALFALAAVFSAYGAYLGFSSLFKVIRRGRGPVLQIHWRRLLGAAGTWITMRPIWRTRKITSLIHAGLAWGFVFYLLVNVVDVVRGYWAGPYPVPEWLANWFNLLADLFSAVVLACMVALLFRRFLVPTARAHLQARADIQRIPSVRINFLRLTVSRDSLIVGVFILCHVGFRLLGESFALSGSGTDAWQPVASAISPAWAGLSDSALVTWEHVCWWLAIGLVLLFVPYFPYTKHIHLIMAGFNFATKPERSSPGALQALDFEDEAAGTFGALKIEELPQTSIADAFACIMCNRCQDVCPAYATGKDLSPAALEINKRYYLNAHMGKLASGENSKDQLIDYAITPSAIWACTSCGACTDICPVGNEPMLDILDLRRGLVLMEDAYPSEFEGLYRGLERNGNPWNIAANDRLEWADGLDIATIQENPNAEVLWWVGCAPAYDQRAQKTARALARVLKAAGVQFAVLGNRERCTGDAARRSGNEYLFDQLARQNIRTLNDVRPKRILTTCPHCLHTLSNEYPALGGTYKVVHHTQLLTELAAENRLPNGMHAGSVTFHDPCYLGRQNGVVEAPRQVLEASGARLTEMQRHGRNSFCCGAGGAQMWKEEQLPSVSDARYREAVATGAETLAVGCPFCLTMLRDAAAEEGRMEVKDVAELMAEQLDTRPPSRAN